MSDHFMAGVVRALDLAGRERDELKAMLRPVHTLDARGIDFQRDVACARLADLHADYAKQSGATLVDAPFLSSDVPCWVDLAVEGVAILAATYDFIRGTAQ